MRQNVLGPPNDSPEKKPTSIKVTTVSASNGAGGTYNAAANRFTAPANPQATAEQERARAEAEHMTAAMLQRQNNALAVSAWRQQTEKDHAAAQMAVRTDPRANGGAAAAQNRPAQTSGTVFNPYDYSPDADLYAQVTGKDPYAGRTVLGQAWQYANQAMQTAFASGNNLSKDQRDAQDILGVGATYTYTGDPEDVARQMYAENGVENTAEYRNALDFYNRNTVGGILDTLRNTVNDTSRRAQSGLAEQESQNVVMSAVGGDSREMQAVYQYYLSSLSPDERAELEITGRLLSPEAIYYLYANQAATEKHKNDELVKAVDWGEKYNRETQRIAEKMGFSERTLQIADGFRGIGRMLPQVFASALLGAGAAALSGDAAELIMGACRVLNGSLAFHSAAGSAYEEAVRNGADQESAMEYATAIGAVELFTDSLVNGMGRLGGRALGLDLFGTKPARTLAKMITEDHIAQEMVIATCSMLGEGVEEYLSELGGYFADRLTIQQDQREFAQVLRDAGDSILPAMMTSALFEFNTFLLEGMDAREAAALATDAVFDDFLERAGLNDEEKNVRGPLPEDMSSTKFYDLQTIQLYDKMERANGGAGLMQRKPPYSPALRRWFNQDGTVEIRVENGHDIWTYTTADGISGTYIDGNIRFSRGQLYADVGEVNIGSFSGRFSDRQKAIKVLAADYGVENIPDGFVLHHDINNGVIQLVRKDVHSIFTHRGGFSIFVINGGK